MNLQRFPDLRDWQAELVVVVIFIAVLLIAGESVNLILFALAIAGFLRAAAWCVRRLYARSRERY